MKDKTNGIRAKDISNCYLFCQAVEYGGFAAASESIAVSAPTISRGVAHLEEQLGEKLIHRNAKHFQLTSAGEEYYQDFSPIFRDLDEQWMRLSNQQATLTGDIRIACPEPFADKFLQAIAINFMQEHPQVNVHIHFASDTRDFFEKQIDLAIVTTPPQDMSLVQRRLFDAEPLLLASPDYLTNKGTPQQVNDLLQHSLLSGNTLPYWSFIQNGETLRIPVCSKYSVNSVRLTLQACCAGIGIALLPKMFAQPMIEAGKLCTVLPDVCVASGNVYMVWADQKLSPVRVSRFKERILDALVGVMV